MNRERLISKMNQEGIDALIASTPENVGYLTNLWMIIQKVARWVDSYALISPARDKPTLISSPYGLISGVDLLEPEKLDIVTFGGHNMYGDKVVSKNDERIKGFLAIEPRANQMEALIEVIKEQNLENAVVGIENLMPLGMLDYLKKNSPRCK